MTSSTQDTLPWPNRLAPPPGSRVVVAGGRGAIGRAVTDACLALDHRVAILDLPASLAAHPAPPGTSGIAMNGTDPAEVAAAFAAVEAAWDGAVDLLVFLIGFSLTPARPLDEITPEQWDEVVRGNLHSAHLVCRAALPLLRRGNQSSIVTISSGLGFSVLKGFGPYSAAKAGLIGLTKILAMENAPRIRANAIAPGAIPTDFFKGGLGREDSDGSWWDPSALMQLVPMQRLCSVDDVVGAVLYLGSPAAGFITGQTLHLNGGRFTP